MFSILNFITQGLTSLSGQTSSFTIIILSSLNISIVSFDHSLSHFARLVLSTSVGSVSSPCSPFLNISVYLPRWHSIALLGTCCILLRLHLFLLSIPIDSLAPSYCTLTTSFLACRDMGAQLRITVGTSISRNKIIRCDYHEYCLLLLCA